MSLKPFSCSFRVHGTPKGQPRPRAFARGGQVRVYDPGTAEGWKSCIAEAAKAKRPTTPLVGCVHVDIDWFFPRPKRLMRKADSDEPIGHDRKPDRDNLDKAVLDALTVLGFWHDDAQVSAGILRKWYCAKPGHRESEPGAWIHIAGYTEESDDAEANRG